MQVDPIKPTLKAPGNKRLKLQHDRLLSSFAFNFNSRRSIEGVGWEPALVFAGLGNAARGKVRPQPAR